MEQWQQFQIMTPKLVPSKATILLIMTSQGWQNALQKVIPAVYIRTLDRCTVHG